MPVIGGDASLPTANAIADPQEVRRSRKAVRLWTGTLVLLCVGTLLLLFRHIERTLPYPQHADEGFISGPASEILQTGNLHPHRFNYPSLPTYIAAASMAVGFVRGAAHLEIRDVNALGQVGYPYYETPRVMQTARQAFALLSVLCLAMTGLSAWLAFRKPVTIFLAPLILLVSPLFLRHSWTYLNVDIVGTSFVMMTLAACLLGTARPSLRQCAVTPGLLAGLTAGSKYTLAVAALPVLTAIGLHFPRARVMWAAAVTVAGVLAGFLVAVPYSLIDIPQFLNGVGYEVFHYASGHAGFAGEPGLEQLRFYLGHFLSEFGYGVAVLAIVGLFWFPRADWRRAAIMTIFPTALLWLLSQQRVHFTRNALAIHPFIAMFAAFGFVTLHERAVTWAAGRGWTTARVKLPVIAGSILVLATLPFWRFGLLLHDRMDSRNVARAWIGQNLPREWAIVVPTELGFDLRGLERRGRLVKRIDLRSIRDPDTLNAQLGDVPAPAAIMVPRWGADRRSPGQREADALNAFSRQWRVLATFGTNDVLVNYLFSTAWGDPAFTIAVLR